MYRCEKKNLDQIGPSHEMHAAPRPEWEPAGGSYHIPSVSGSSPVRGGLNPEANPNGGTLVVLSTQTNPNRPQPQCQHGDLRATPPGPRERHGVITLVKTYGFLASSQEPGQKSRVLQLVKPQRSEQKTSQKRVGKADDKRPPDHLEYKCVQVIE